MTLDEMIDAVESEKRAALSNMSYETAEQIIAALKAGQALRKESGVTIQYLTMTGQKYRNAYDDACQAWDAALKDDQ